MNMEKVNFDNVDYEVYPANPVIEALMKQVLILNKECSLAAHDDCRTWEVMNYSLKNMISDYVFETQPTGKEATNLSKLIFLTYANDLPLEKALPILSNWRKLHSEKLDYWINRRFKVA